MANTPEEICSLFKRYMGEGDLEALLNLYDTDAVFLNQSGETKQGKDEIRQELAPLAGSRAAFDFTIRRVIYAGDLALMHTDWKVSSPRQMSAYAVEVARRQRDGTWRWVIGDPFTVGRRVKA